MTTKAKRRWACAAVLALAAAALLSSSNEPSQAAPSGASPATAKTTEPLASEQRRPAKLTQPQQAAKARPPVDDIVIEKVEVDKQELCRGEDVTVTVQAQSRDKEDQYLAYGSLGHPELVGPRFTFKPEESVGVDWMKVFVRGKLGTSVVASVPPILVKDCSAPLSVTIDYQRPADAQDRAQLGAQVATTDGVEPFEAVEYEWDFGDGTREKTTAAHVVHSYENRQQTQAYSYFFVTVKARDAAGRIAHGSRSLRYVNLGFLPMANQDRVVVFAGIEQIGTTERVALYHGAPFSVQLERVTVKDVLPDGSDTDPVASGRDYEAASVLGFSQLPAGKSIETRDLAELRPAEPGAIRVVEISGRGPGATRVDGAFTLLGPPLELAQHDSVDSTETEMGTEE